jgi:hypothetical protein
MFRKLEITFQVDTAAQNLQLPYDATPPVGIQPEFGVSVDGLFSPDGWQTVYTQPAFYYQEFEDQVKSEREWFYPTGGYAWKVRFSTDRSGTWEYKIRARDASGMRESETRSFTVVVSDEKGFVRVSERDPRYFELQDGTYFPGLGYNMNFDHVSWVNPVLDNEENFKEMSENGIQLVRMWLSQWAIYGSAWNPWQSIDGGLHAQYIPYTGLLFRDAYPGSEVSMEVWAKLNPCMFMGWLQAQPAVKRNTDYRVRIRYRTEGISGPRAPGEPYGFVAKTGGWLWGGGEDCHEPGTGTAVTPYQAQNVSEWSIWEGSLNSGNRDFLPYFYLALENVTDGIAHIDTVWIEEDLGDGNYGPNIVSKPWMAHHLYMEQRNSYAFDKVLELAEKYDIYLRPVILEKNDWLFNRFDYEGSPILDDPACWDAEKDNDPQACPHNRWFYGNWRAMTKTRWLQQAWWRYLQARWGYSPNIHSWELLNEGDPWNGLHYTLADEFGKYMHQFGPNSHLVSTSFWHSFPKDTFWANSEFSNVDFADIHQYIPQSDAGFVDTAAATYNMSMQVGAKAVGGAGMPVIRGETGFTEGGSGPASPLINQDTEGLWLHNFVWGGINPGGLIESYWYETTHIYQRRQDGGYTFDHRPIFKTFSEFMRDIPLSNGNYGDAEAEVSVPGLRAWGQKDLVNGRAHLWLQNKAHNWRNVVEGVQVDAVTGAVTIGGFPPGVEFVLEWWDTYQVDRALQVTAEEKLRADADGRLRIDVVGLEADTAVKIYPFGDEPDVPPQEPEVPLQPPLRPRPSPVAPVVYVPLVWE